MKILRTHDSFYSYEDRKNQPKEYFKFIAKKIAGKINQQKNPLLLDIGCATGEFIAFFKSLFPQVRFTGIDVMEELLSKAKVNCPDSEFIYGNIVERNTLPQNKYDFVFLLAVHSIWDDPKIWIDNLKYLTRQDGHAYVFGMFNPEPVDVFVKSRRTDIEINHLESGWNVISINTINKYLNEINARYSWEEWKIGIPIEKNKNDPLRAWIIKDNKNNYLIVNGLQILHKLFFLEITF